jgi:hypothetical protein
MEFADFSVEQLQTPSGGDVFAGRRILPVG